MDTYSVSKNTDSIGNDCGFFPNKTIDELKVICENTQDAEHLR